MSLDKHLQNNSRLTRDKFLLLRAVVHSFPRKHDRLGERMLLTEEQTGTASRVPWMNFYSHFRPYAGSLENAPNMWNSRKLPSSGVNAVLAMAASRLHIGMRLTCVPSPLSPLPLEGNMDA